MPELEEEYGIKRICQSCAARYYDLNKDPAVCPSCGTEFDPESLLKSRRGRSAAKDETVKAPSKDEGDEAEDDLIEKSDEENFDNRNVLNQSIMRYNQFLSFSSSITIPGDFDLHAGDAITLDVPLIEVDKTKKKSNMDSGLYIITDLTHYMTGETLLTRLELVRDSIGIKRN